MNSKGSVLTGTYLLHLFSCIAYIVERKKKKEVEKSGDAKEGRKEIL